MKRKKNNRLGFTMIEMLATILVLLVILLIATPSIRRMLNKTNEVSKSYTEEIVLDAAREYASVNNREITSTLKLVNDTKIVSLQTLNNMGLIEEEDLTSLGSTARVLLTLLANSSIKFEIVYDDSLVENAKPQIILLGDNPHYVKQGTVYRDPGYIAFDRTGTVVTEDVIVNGTVNTSVLGSVVLNYTLTDSQGYTADALTRTVIVVDSTYPTVTVATAVSNNAYNNKFAKNGDIITLSLTFSKAVTDPTVTIGNRIATVTGSGSTRTATYTIPAGETVLVSKELGINISNYEDIYENQGITKTNVTSGGLVVYDNIKPVITGSTMVSNNTNNKLARNGQVLTMTTTFSEIVRGVSSRLGSRAATVSGDLTATATSTYTIPAAEATMTQGNILGEVLTYMDRAGNVATDTNIKLGGGAVVYDRTAPIAPTHTPALRAWENTNVSIALSATDSGGSNLSGYQYCSTTNGTTCTPVTSGGTVTFTTDGQYTMCSRALDNAGNIGSTTCSAANAYKVDKTAPIATTHTPASRTWGNTDVTVTISVSDPLGSGVSGYQYCSTTNGTTCTPVTSGGTVTFSVEGQYTLCSRAVDIAGNIGATTCSSANAYPIDKTIPVTTTHNPTSRGWSSANVSIALSATDLGGSGVSGYQYCSTTNGTNCTPSTVGGTVSLTTEGQHTVCSRAMDAAGNPGAITCSAANAYKIDKTGPTCVSSGGSATWVQSRTIVGTCTDPLSGCVSATINKTYAINTNSTTESPGTVMDNAGNPTICPGNQTVNVDIDPPTCAVSGGSSTWTKGSRTINGICTDTGGSGCTGNLSQLYSTQTNITNAGPAGAGVQVKVYDNAGNPSVEFCATNQTVKIDKTNPSCSFNYSTTAWTNGSVTATMSTSDSNSGVEFVQIEGMGKTSPPYSQTFTSNAAWYMYVYDYADNFSGCSMSVANIDKDVPICSVSGGNPAWTNTSRTIVGHCSSDTGGSGCNPTDISYTYSNEINTTTAGAGGNGVGGSIYDIATNPGACSALQTVRIDKTAPTATTHTPASRGWGNTSIAIALSTTEAGGSGVLRYESCYTTTGATCTPQNVGAPASTINLTTEGQYTVCSRAIDVAGNIGATTCSAANAYKIDVTSPLTTSHSPASRDWANTDVSIALSATDSGGSAVASYQYCSTTTGVNCTPSTAGGTITLSATGQYTVCSRALDTAGNVGPITCSAANAYKIDKSAPGTPSHSPASRGWSNANISVALSATDTGGSGLSGYQYCATTGASCTPSSAGDTVPLAITGEFTVCSRALDVAGNTGATTCSAANAYKIDKVIPTCTMAGGTTLWTNGTRTITGTCGDTGGSGCASTTLQYVYGDEINTNTAGVGGNGVGGIVYDNAGNAGNCSPNQTVRIDKTNPGATGRSPSSQGWTNGNISITITGTDTGGSDISDYQYCYTTTGATCAPTTVGSTITLSATGQYTVCTKSRDAADNFSTAVCSAANAYKIDKVAPSCVSSGGSATWAQSRTITGTCSDTGGSGCTGNASHTFTTNINSTTASPGSVSDAAGNTTACPADQTVKTDVTPPTCTSSGGLAGWVNTPRTITGTCSDTGGSGCTGNISHTYSTEMNITNAGPGGAGVGGTVSDVAGNVSAACATNQTVRIDITAPACLVTGGRATWGNTNVTVSAACLDTGGSGCSDVDFSYTYTDNIDTTLGSARGGSVLADVLDNAGNRTECGFKTVRIDKTAPTCAVSGGTTIWTNGTRTISATCSDTGGSGCSGNLSYVYSPEINTTTAGAGGNGVGGTVYDNAGNSVGCAANQTVRIDKTYPSCVSSGGSATWVQSRTITGTCSDTGGSGCDGNVTKTYSTNTSTTTASPGSVSDGAGNITSCPANQTVNVDVTNPTCAVSGGTTIWTNGTRVITGTCSDTGGSGCTGNISYTYSTQISTTTAGAAGNTVGGTVYDNAGNSAACAPNQTVRIDKTAPTCASAGGDPTWWKTDRTITGTCSDTGGSGCDGNVSRTFTANTNTTYSPGTVYDAAGNSVSCAVQTVKIDKTPPTCVANKTNTYTTGGVTVTIVGTDTGGSGIAYGEDTFTGRTTDGTTSVYDSAGNSGSCSWDITAQAQTRTTTCATYTSCQNSACGTASCSTSGCGYATCRTSACGCQTYATCANSACGCSIYNSCANSVCGCSLYNYCANSACGYATCANSACGCSVYSAWVTQSSSKVSPCSTATYTYSRYTCASYSTSTTVCDNYGCDAPCYTRTYQTRSCSTYASCATSGCGYASCRTSACGCQTYASCVNSSCTCATYKSCATSACGCALYNSCAASACGYATCVDPACGYNTCATAACGCTTWNTWSSWTTATCSATPNVRQCESRTVYY